MATTNAQSTAAAAVTLDPLSAAVLTFSQNHSLSSAQGLELSRMNITRNVQTREGKQHSFSVQVHKGTKRKDYMTASIAQMVGVEKSGGAACESCQKGTRGPFATCVVVAGTRNDGGKYLLGNCANCHWSAGHRKKCSFRA